MGRREGQKSNLKLTIEVYHRKSGQATPSVLIARVGARPNPHTRPTNDQRSQPPPLFWRSEPPRPPGYSESGATSYGNYRPVTRPSFHP